MRVRLLASAVQSVSFVAPIRCHPISTPRPSGRHGARWGGIVPRRSPSTNLKTLLLPFVLNFLIMIGAATSRPVGWSPLGQCLYCACFHLGAPLVSLLLASMRLPQPPARGKLSGQATHESRLSILRVPASVVAGAPGRSFLVYILVGRGHTAKQYR